MLEITDFFYMQSDGGEDFHTPIYKKRNKSSFPDYGNKEAKIIRGEYVPDFVPSFTLSKKAQNISLSIVTPCIGSVLRDPVLKLWQQNKVTGYQFFPVNLRRTFNWIVETGYQIGITGRCGSLSFNRSEPAPQNDNPYVIDYYGFSFDIASWDGSDIFCTSTRSDNTINIVTRRLRDICVKAGVEGVSFVPLDKFHSHSLIREEMKE